MKNLRLIACNSNRRRLKKRVNWKEIIDNNLINILPCGQKEIYEKKCGKLQELIKLFG
jgi:hypothetical protein